MTDSTIARVRPGADPQAPSPEKKAPEKKAASRRAVRAAMIGNFVEWFDYGIYGYLAPVIAVVFFPGGDATAALLSTYAVFALSFFIRPLGGVVFGRLADKRGRQVVLSATILLMSVATLAIGLLPSYAAIGIAAPLLLLLCRLVQGFAAGGEYAGAVSFVVEYGPRNKRALYASFVSVSVFLGLLASSGLIAGLTAGLSADDLNSWGWRIPFLLAAPIGLVGLYIRMKLEETPEFQEVVDAGEVESSPLRDALSTQWRTMLVFFGFAITNAIGSYLFSSYLSTYLTTELGFSKNDALLANTVAVAVLVLLLPLSGLLTDRIGRRPMLIAGTMSFIVLSVPAFLLAEQGGFLSALLAELVFVVALFFIAVPVTVSIAEMFPTNVRCTAGAIAYNLAFTVFGGTAPFVATALIGGTGVKLAPAFYVMAVAAVSLVVVVTAYRERRPT